MRVLFEHWWKVSYYHPLTGERWERSAKNLIPTQMLNSILNADQDPPNSGYALQFYIGLVDLAGFSAYAAADTAASHAGWAENTDYDEATRQALVRSNSTAAAWDNVGNEAVFTMNATGTLKGFFIQSASAKGSTAGILGGEVNFTGGNEAFTPGGVLTVTIEGTAASA